MFAQLRIQWGLSQINTGVPVAFGNSLWFGVLNSFQQAAKFQQESSPPPILRNRRVRQGMNPRSAPLQLNVYMRIISGHTIWDMLAQKQLYFLTTSQNPDPTNCPEIATPLSK